MSPRRYLDALTSLPASLGTALAGTLKEGYGSADFRADAMAGVVVGIVALPLSMALAIASGAPPQHGLYTTIIAGFVCALLGGSRWQVTGPTAAFTVLLLPVVQHYGVGGLFVAGALAGLVLVGMGLLRLGNLITFVPHPVTTGFTAGIAVVLITAQLPDLFGLHVAPSSSFVMRWRHLVDARHTFAWPELAIGLLTFLLINRVQRYVQKFPAPLFALTGAAIVAAVAHKLWPVFHVDTIGSRFHTIVGDHIVDGIPRLPPLPILPWHVAGPDGQPLGLSFELVRELAPVAFAIAMLGGIETLLSATAADGAKGTRTDPNTELTALGIANFIAPFFGGIPAVGAMARTATSLKAGARSPIASAMHAVFVLACTVPLAPLVSYLPMSALAALVIVVAKNMAEPRHFLHIVRVAPRADAAVLLVCFFLTVLFDMVLAVSVGVVLAALLFMNRMAAITETHLETQPTSTLPTPPGVRLYHVGGPLFFGAAQKALGILDDVGEGTRIVVLLLEDVPTIDATGLVALETLLARKKRRGRFVILAGLRPRVAEVLGRAHVTDPQYVAVAPDIDAALAMANERLSA